jgi:hypothetical protein
LDFKNYWFGIRRKTLDNVVCKLLFFRKMAIWSHYNIVVVFLNVVIVFLMAS